MLFSTNDRFESSCQICPELSDDFMFQHTVLETAATKEKINLISIRPAYSMLEPESTSFLTGLLEISDEIIPPYSIIIQFQFSHNLSEEMVNDLYAFCLVYHDLGGRLVVCGTNQHISMLMKTNPFRFIVDYHLDIETSLEAMEY